MKNIDLRVKVSEEEAKIIESKAKALGLTVSAYLRILGLKAKCKIDVVL